MTDQETKNLYTTADRYLGVARDVIDLTRERFVQMGGAGGANGLRRLADLLRDREAKTRDVMAGKREG